MLIDSGISAKSIKKSYYLREKLQIFASLIKKRRRCGGVCTFCCPRVDELYTVGNPLSIHFGIRRFAQSMFISLFAAEQTKTRNYLVVKEGKREKKQ